MKDCPEIARLKNFYKVLFLEFKNKEQIDGECIAYSEKVDGLNEDAIHVVEYDALQEALNEIERLNKQIEFYRRIILKAQTLLINIA